MMNIKVRVLSNRKCHSSIDHERQGRKSRWIISFGNAKRPDNDVEVEFTNKQLLDHRNMLNELVQSKEFTEKTGLHYGLC